MSTDEAGVLADLDARAIALIGAPYTAIRTAMLNGLFSVVAYAVARWTPSASGAASAVKTTGADVDVGGAAPPSAGKVLTATDATHATWQTPSTGTTDHAALTSNLAWASSGHTGTASKVAGFSGAGAAAYYTIGSDLQAWDADLDALAALSSTAGMLSRTGAGAWAVRTLTAPAAGLTISNPTGAAGNPTLALADDLSALEALSGTGYAKRTGTSTWSVSATVPWADIASKPTTLSGYGITDGLSTSTSWSGDLGGTGTSPTVTQARGLRETSGPTTLVVGSIADGQMLKRVGSTLVGAWLSVSCVVASSDGVTSHESIVLPPTPPITLPAGAPV